MDDNPFFLGQLLFSVLIILIVVFAFLERSRRERHRLELQKAILERVGSVKDLAEFLTTEQGQRFLSTLAPAYFRPHHRGLWSVRIGVVILTIGLFLMVAFHLPLFSTGTTTPPALLTGILLLIAAGTGMLLSAAVSFLIARRLGITNGQGGGSRKNDAE
jgi:hypothetical protein